MDRVEYGKPAHTERQIGCARCHGPGHDDLTYRPLTHFIEFTSDGSIATHWCRCPTNGEPILLCVSGSADVNRLRYEQRVAHSEAQAGIPLPVRLFVREDRQPHRPGTF